MTDHTEHDLGVLLGIRNILDRTLELLDAHTDAAQAAQLSLVRPPRPVLYDQVVSQRTELQGIIDRWPKAWPKVDPKRHIVVFHGEHTGSLPQTKLNVNRETEQ